MRSGRIKNDAALWRITKTDENGWFTFYAPYEEEVKLIVDGKDTW